MPLGFDPKMEAEIQAQSKGRPFGVCPVCNLRQIPQSAASCNECARLQAMKMAIPKDPGSGVQDTQVPQSYPSNDHSGFSTTAPSGKFNPKKGRV